MGDVWRRRASKVEEGPKGAPGWMVTYGDMMGLILSFFVLLVSFSSIQKTGFHKAITSIREALDVAPPKAAFTTYGEESAAFTSLWGQRVKLAESRIRAAMTELGIREAAQTEVTAEGIKITLEDQVLFDLGKAELKPEGQVAIQKLGEVFAILRESKIEIDGHTDDIPIRPGGEFKSNWELSGARALTVLHALVGGGYVLARDVYFAGYADTRPRAPNDSVEHRQQNRRVEIFVKTPVPPNY